jgi:cardiolipin synthase
MWSVIVDFWPLFLAATNITLAIAATIHIVLRKRDGRAAISWTGLVWLAPLIGSIAYFLLGINRIQRKAVALHFQNPGKHRQAPKLTDEEKARRDRFVSEHPNLIGLATLVQHLTRLPALAGNSVTPLVNGDQAYPAMIKAIDGATRSVSLLSYIFDSDQAGQLFVDALKRAKERGVEVRVLVDDVGSRYSRPNIVRRLQEAGIQAAAFLPARAPRLFKYANLRNHRKILVVDGQIGFTGGTNIRECHWMAKKPSYPVQCVHFRIQGPVVAHLQEVFAIDWDFTTGEQLTGDLWFPLIEREGTVWARGIPDGPDEYFETLSETMQGALATATQYVRIVTPYFLPDPSLISALTVTALRGVDVRIYVPEKTNFLLVDWATTASFVQLLTKGCRIFLTPPPFDHSKLLVVDDVWSLIGSTNWDPRSLRLNFEFNVECYDETLARHLSMLVQSKAQGAKEVTLAELGRRSFPVRLREGLTRLLTPYL